MKNKVDIIFYSIGIFGCGFVAALHASKLFERSKDWEPSYFCFYLCFLLAFFFMVSVLRTKEN